MELKDNEIRLIEAELPNLSLRLGLYLNAGLVVSAAFCELVSANEADGPLYRLLRGLDRECREKNMPLVGELFKLSREMRSKTLMRFSALVADNQNKGGALAEKLDRERALLQNARLNLARGKAKEAETRLCFPLMLLLVSLIIICSAPALMQM